MNEYSVVFETTPECDNDCKYCYNIWKKTRNPYPITPLGESILILENIISKIKPTGICFSGGEPLLCPDIFDLIKLSRGRVKMVSLATNGRNLGEDFFSKITPKLLGMIDISLPTLDNGKYAEICGSEGLEEVKSAIALTKKKGFRLNISITAMKVNLEQISEILEFAYAFSANSVFINIFTPSGRGEIHRKELLLSMGEKIQIIKIADKFSGKTGMQIFFGIPFERCRADISSYKNIHIGPCLCGIVKFAVDFLGNIRPCEQSDLVLGNVFRDDFRTVLESDGLAKFRSDNLSKNCADCIYYSNCLGGCRFSDERV